MFLNSHKYIIISKKQQKIFETVACLIHGTSPLDFKSKKYLVYSVYDIASDVLKEISIQDYEIKFDIIVHEKNFYETKLYK